MGGGPPQVDDSGGCALHPGIQLRHQKKSGEWRVLLNACPLCVSGLPATGASVAGTKEGEGQGAGQGYASSGGNITSEELDKKIQMKKKAKSKSKDARSGSSGRSGSRGRAKKSPGTPPSARPRSPSPQSPAIVRTFKNEEDFYDDDSSGAAMSADFNSFLQYLEKGGEQGQKQNGDQGLPRNEQPQHQQPAPIHQGVNAAAYCSPVESDYGSAADTLSPGDSTPRGFGSGDETSETEDTSHMIPMMQPQNAPQGMNANQAQSGGRLTPPRPRQRAPPLSKTPPGQRSKSPYNRNQIHVPPPQHDHPSATPPNDMPESPRRPDPEDTEEFNHLYQGHHQPKMAPRGGYPVHHLQQHEPQQQEPPLLEQDEVSMLDDSSVTRTAIQRQKELKEREMMAAVDDDGVDTESSDRSSSSSSGSSSSDEEDSTPQRSRKSSDRSNGWGSNTAKYDEHGWCVNHPTVRLRKKQMLRGWKIVLSNCPECCLDEMRKVKDERTKNRYSRRDSKNSRSKGSSKKKKRKSKRDKMKNPPVSQVNLKGKGSKGYEHEEHSVGTASTITISSNTQSSGGNKWQNYASDSKSVGSGGRSVGSNGNDSNSASSPPNGPAVAKVTRMPYSDNNGEHGWYTGQVDAATGSPHGMGTMNYSNGAVNEGEWRDGVCTAPNTTREEPLHGGAGGGHFGGGFSSPRGVQKRYHRPLHHRHPMATSGRSYLATLDEDATGSDYENGRGNRSGSASPAPQPERSVVCGMQWVDVHGDSGVYTGEVNDSGIPDGMGSVRYDGGLVTEGMWCEGRLEDDEYSDNGDDVGEEVEGGSLPAMYSGFDRMNVAQHQSWPAEA